MSRRHICTIAALTALIPAAVSAQRLTPAQTAAIDSTLSRLFALNLSPGAGVVVVRDTQVVYVNGFGFADRETRRPFTSQTVHYIASTTKAFTGLTAAILDIEGRFRLDAPLIRYLPQVKLRAPLNPDSITIAALLTHTHGIGEGPVTLRLAYTGEFKDNDQLVGLLSEHAALPDRSYRYSNLGYNIATLAMDRVTGESWKQTLDRLIFTPLGMRNTSATVSRFPSDRLAMPYGLTPTDFERIPYGKVDANMQSAGGLVTTLDDLARWLEANLNDGRIDGQQAVPAAAVREAHRVRASMQENARNMKMFGYALGWNVGTYGRDTIFTHGGGFPGFATQVSFIPRRGVGIAAFANSDLGGAFTDLAGQLIYDVLAGAPPLTADSLAALRSLVDRQRAGLKAELERRGARPQVTPLPFSAYAGTYESPVMGTIVLTVNRAGKLEARAGAAWSKVEVYDGTKHQLRVELFGNGAVLSMEVQGDGVVAATLSGYRYARVR